MSLRRIFPGLFPPDRLTAEQSRNFFLVGVAALFAGYDLSIFSFVIPQVLSEFAIPANMAAPTVSVFRLAAIPAMALCASADLIGRRKLLLFTILGQALGTAATAFAGDYTQFVAAQIITRIFGYTEEMLCFVVIAEIMAQHSRGWSTGMLITFYWLGGGIASLAFSFINILPHGWRAIYIFGTLPLLLVAYMRRNLNETQRFVEQSRHIQQGTVAKTKEAIVLLKRLAREHPRRVIAIMLAVIGFGFAVTPATVLASTYLQTTLHYSPGQVTMLVIPGGLLALLFNLLAARYSDRFGRKSMVLITAVLCIAGFVLFYNAPGGWLVPAGWVMGFFGFFAADALLAGFAMEIVPTDYRAMVGGLRYLLEIGAGAISLLLEGFIYDNLGGHGPAATVCLLSVPLTLIALLFLPEPAGKSLEELTAC
jgi:MFS family permease